MENNIGGINMELFEKEVKTALKKMINERKEKWDVIQSERQEISDEIGQITAELKFWNALGKPQDTQYLEKKRDLDKLHEVYHEHVNKYRMTADKLNQEIDILEQLK